MTIETVEFGGWADCLRLSTAEMEAVVTRAVGPRVVRFGRPGGPNLFREFPEQHGRSGGTEWRMYGGHRLWHGPEALPRSYQPDNDPVEAEIRERGVRLVQRVEPATGIRKSIDLELTGTAFLTVTHTLTNEGLWSARLAPWAITILAPGGLALIPQPPLGSHTEHLLPNRSLVLWSYTSLGDPRLEWGARLIRFRPNPATANPVKIGAASSEGWCGCLFGRELFLKQVRHVRGAEYPDLGSGIECFTQGDFLELETLGPLVDLAPGSSATHVEEWSLHSDVDTSSEETLFAAVGSERPRSRDA